MNNKNFIFSIIMPIYNVDKWLEEAIDSVINQKRISFEQDIQLILVNDCSPDNSEDICLRYKNKYPHNIEYIKNPQNMGLSNTRNNGLNYIKGKYINFFDPDDILSDNVLYEVHKFFIEKEREGVELAHVSIPLEFFEAAKGLHPKYNILGNKNRIIDLDKEGYNFILSSASSFYPAYLIKDHKFDSSLFGEEDTLFNFKIYKNIRIFGYVVENNVRYHYRKRYEGGSQVDQSRVKPQSFYTPIQLINKVDIEENSTLFYELCLYQLRSRFKNIKPSIFETEQEYYAIINEYRKIINKIPIEFILKNTKFISDIEQKISFISNIYSRNIYIDKEANVCIDGNVLFKINDLPVDIKRIVVEKEHLVIETLLNNYNTEELEVVIFTDSREIINPKLSYYTESLYTSSAAGIKSSSKILYSKFEIPVFKIGKYKIYIRRNSNGYIHIANKLRTYSESPFLANGVFNTSLFRLYTDFNTSISFFKRVFRIEKTTKTRKFINRIKSFLLIKKQHKTYKWLRLLKIRKPKYWLFNDRPINANDNAEYFFEYINTNHPSIAKKSFFVLSKDSPDIERMKKIGRVVIQNSLYHKYLYLNARYIFTSHLATSFFKPISFKHLKYYNDISEAKIIWLQHGITMNDIESAANKFNKQVYKVVTSASFEECIFAQNKFFYQSDDILKVGFPRHDKLNKEKNNNILIMPTWRSYLSGNILSNGLHAEKPGFVDSDFYMQYSSLLSNNRLLEALSKFGYSIKFILHPGFKQYTHYFEKFENDIVEIIKDSSFSYNQLFNNSALLITDYSSVFFDFSYAMKPCLFFQFDRDSFYGKHYKKGIFDFDTMAPGKVSSTVDNLVNDIIELMDKNMNTEPRFIKTIKGIYPYNDNRNCERLLGEIIKYE